MVGGATPDASGAGAILSLRKLNCIRRLDPAAGLAVVEAGVILQMLHEAAAAEGRRFPLTLGARGSATIGGLIATNAGGTQVLRFGPMRDLVLGVEAVLPNGEVYNGLTPLKKDNRGYDLDQLLIGSEGTLGVITAATLKLPPAAIDVATAWLAVPSPGAALALLRGFEQASGEAIESFELIPERALTLVLKHIAGTRRPVEARGPWHVLIDFVGPNARERLEALLGDRLTAGAITDALVSRSEAEAAALWRIRDAISEAERNEGPTLAHDISVAVDAMPAFMEAARQAVEARFVGVTASAFGHLGDGNVHFHVSAPPGASSDWRARHGQEISQFVYDLVTQAGGSISAEHGIGQMKRAELARLAEPARLNALRAIKAALDPLCIMNPGKLIP